MSALSVGSLHGYHDDPIVNSPFALVTSLNVSVFALLWYIALTHWNLSNYVAWVRYNSDLLNSQPPTQIYLAFVVLSEVILWVLSGPLFFYTAKYRRGQKDRNKYLSLGLLAAYLSSDVPFFILDLVIVYYHGIYSVVQTCTLILRCISFFFGSIAVWQIYLHRMTKYLQSRYQSRDEQRMVALKEEEEATRREHGIKTHESKILSLIR